MNEKMSRAGIPRPYNRSFRQLKQLLWSLVLLSLSNTFLYSEGSVDFIDYPGFRLFYGADVPQQLKVYAASGEFINVGTSHVDISGGTISVYRPDGTLHTTYDNSGATAGLGIIYNDIQEKAGPTGGGSTMGDGYIPGVISVGDGEAGVWTITFNYPNPINFSFPNIMNSDPWTREDNQPSVQRAVLAWDVTISQGAAGNEGGTLLEGRLFSKEYVSVVSQNGNTTSPQHCVLTKDGFKYRINFMDTDPYNFPLLSNNVGIMNGDYMPSYQSAATMNVNRANSIDDWVPGLLYLYNPQAQDQDFISNNKIFFNTPNPDMPSAATTTDIFNDNTYETWLYNVPPVIDLMVNGFEFTGANAADPLCDDGSSEIAEVAHIIFTSTLGGTGTLQLDLNSDGDYDDAIDRSITEFVNAEGDTITWDGLDGEGNVFLIPDSFQLNYQMQIRGGEIHIVMEDVENNLGGVTFELVNADGEIDHNDEFYYDHSPIGTPADVSGGGTPGNALPTTTPYTYSSSFGNEKMLDYWTFVDYGESGTALFVANNIFNCANENDTDMDGIPDIIDIDDENDGVPDVLEYCSASGNFDCLPGGVDPSEDADMDGIVNYLDADDAAFTLGCTDADGDGRCDEVLAIFDIDGDGVPNHLDLDSDQDGILDLVEAGHGQADLNGDGIIDGLPAEFGENGLYNPIASDPDALDATATYTPWDKDADGVEDYHDLDSDNDGLHDVEEAGYAGVDTDNDGRINTGTSNAQGLAPLIDPVITGLPVPLPLDNDGDGVPDWHDLDSDNDRIHDVLEGMASNANIFIDLDNNGIIGGEGLQVDANGLAITDDNALVITTTSAPHDTDGDSIPDYHDLDSDNDGINDVGETGIILDPDDDGIIGTGTPVVDEDGRAVNENGDFITLSFPKDEDADAFPDFRDLDSDNDGINDVAESDHPDADGDGIIGTGMPIVNPNGQATADAEGNVLVTDSSPVDTDGDSYPDYNDLDSDNDGINDTREADQPDEDNDGIIGTGTPVVNMNGQATAGGDGFPVSTTSDPTNTDGDENPDYRDLDTDNDGIDDVIEANYLDPDNNGMVGTGIPDVNENGQATGENTPTSDPTDTDGDLIPDFRELDSDDDGILDEDECPDDNTCTDGDDDGIFDFQDIDRDNDGILDMDECPTGAPCVDTDMDGEPDVDDLDSDDGGISDMDECPGGAPCPDNDNNGIPDVLEVGCNEMGNAPMIANIGTEGTLCEGNNITLTANNSNEDIMGDIIYTWSGPNDFMFTDTTSADGFFVATLSGASVGDSGDYTLMIFENEDCPATPATITVTINPTPDTPTISSDSEVNCPVEPIVLNTTAYDGEVTYDWYLDGNLVTTTTDPSLSIDPETATSGIYTVIANVNGCSSDLSEGFDLNIGTPPTIVDLSPIDPQCEGGDITLSGANGNLDIMDNIIYTWSGPNGFIFTDTTSAGGLFVATLSGASAGDSGDYTLMIVTENGCAADPATLTLTVNPIPDTPTITADPNPVCEGESIILNTDAYDGDVSYEWFFTDVNGNTTSVGTTTDPTLELPDANPDQGGTYTVVATVNACDSDASEGVVVNIIESLDPADLTNSTSEDNPACIGDDVQLNAPEIEGATYEWSGPNGFMSDIPNPVISPVTAADAGDYTVMIGVGECPPVTSNPTTVYVYEPVVPVIGAAGTFCEGETVTISVQNDLNLPANQTVTYEWFDENGVSVAITDEPNLVFEDAMTENSGTYTLVVTVGDCSSEVSNEVEIIVQPVPTEEAMVIDEGLVVCDDGEYTISAVESAGGYAGTWTSSTGATIANPNSAETTVSDLQNGENEFVWTLTDPVCGDFSSASLVITQNDGAVTAANDELTVSENMSGTVNVLTNDNVGNGVTLTITAEPASGTVTIGDDGIATYTPNAGFSGNDSFTYQICNVECPDACAEATVNITVEMMESSCDVPNTFTPNGDAVNETFIVPCLETTMLNNRVQVFNRWGDIVFETEDYRNDWAGTYDGEPLPPGVYFYCLFYDKNDEDPVSGYITIVR